MDDALRTQLWNITYVCYFERDNVLLSSYVEFYGIWTELMERDWDRFRANGIDLEIKNWIKNREWYEVYDLLEELTQITKVDAADLFNSVLERYKAGYRLLDGRVVPISDSHELSEIESALTTESDSAAHHLQTALSLLADREKPDYPNSIKESISAVEAFLAPITGKSTLGAALGHLKKTDDFAHPALLDAWSKLYGWTSDESGVRHGGVAVPADRLTQHLARYMLVSCSAFINLMTAEQAAGRLPS